jgi:rubredoxin
METKNKSDLIRVFVKGGFLSPADLLKLMDLSKSLGNKHILFGSRQDILFPLRSAEEVQLQVLFNSIHIDYELGNDQSIYQNIVSSYAAVNIVDTTTWLKEDTYNVIIDSFDYKPKVKINIVDPLQSLVPLFTGELNFLASKEENYWFLYIRDPRKKDNLIERWPRLIASNDISRIAKALEEFFVRYQPFTTEELYIMTKHEHHRINYKPIGEKLRTSESGFPYYEGLNAMLNNQYWLGLYWRNNKYDIDFMNAACKLCQQTDISKINIIPWKAFIIKGIKAADRIRWEKLMGKFGINERHSSIELNWHLPVVDNDALELKRFLVRELDQQDISTHGLTFAIKTTREFFYFTTIVIEQCPKGHSSHVTYNILYVKDFNPNNTVYFIYARQVVKEMIPALLIELSKLYFRQLNPEKELRSEDDQVEMHPLDKPVFLYQCSNCLTVYDEKWGDPAADIMPETSFDQLPDSYKCSVCESPKRDFIPLRSRLDLMG